MVECRSYAVAPAVKAISLFVTRGLLPDRCVECLFKRFGFDMATLRRFKLDCSLEFPVTLDMSPFVGQATWEHQACTPTIEQVHSSLCA